MKLTIVRVTMTDTVVNPSQNQVVMVSLREARLITLAVVENCITKNPLEKALIPFSRVSGRVLKVLSVVIQDFWI